MQSSAGDQTDARRKRRLALVLKTAALALPISGLVFASVPHSFKAGDQLTSAALNDNFGAVAPAGIISAYGGGVAPAGWLLCDGSAVSCMTYAALFAAIGTSYGAGDGAMTFNVPDLRGRFVRGVDGDAGRDPDRNARAASSPGGATGNFVGSVQDDAFESHTHTVTQAPVGLLSPGGLGTGATYNLKYTPFETGDAGTSTETRPTNVYVNYIIKQ
jgi:phage-related tail fiber protein